MTARRQPHRRTLLRCLTVVVLTAGVPFAASVRPAVPARQDGEELAREALDAAWLESNLRFALRRAREDLRPRGKVGVFLGRGVSAPSAQAIVRRLEEARVVPRLLFEGDSLDGLECVVMPGGWAPSQQTALGPRGTEALRKFVGEGGRYVGICAGAYLACRTVKWEDGEIPYTLRLARGRAFGPVKGLAPWPASGPVDVEWPDGHRVRGLYAGGCAFDVRGAKIRARYPDGSPAMIEAKHGKGTFVLTGVHFEFTKGDADLLAGWAEGFDPGTGKLVGELVLD